MACRGLPYPRSSSSRIAAIRAVSLFAFSAKRLILLIERAAASAWLGYGISAACTAWKFRCSLGPPWTEPTVSPLLPSLGRPPGRESAAWQR